MRKFTKIDVFYLIASYFMMFAFIGAIFNVVVQAIAWSISIFIILWCAYWFYQYMIEMHKYIDAELKRILENMEIEKKKNIKK